MREQQGAVQESGESQFLTCERIVVFVLLMVSAGMMGAYTYVLRGGVFCNAQTANIVMKLGAWFLFPYPNCRLLCGGIYFGDIATYGEKDGVAAMGYLPNRN